MLGGHRLPDLAQRVRRVRGDERGRPDASSPIVVVANTRDAVDAATSAVLAVAPRARVARLHSDQSADEPRGDHGGFPRRVQARAGPFTRK